MRGLANVKHLDRLADISDRLADISDRLADISDRVCEDEGCTLRFG
jgi:uncharacterized protein Yka (UPF0111/DUF47 family)